MTSPESVIRIRRHDSIDDFSPNEWDSLIGSGGFYGSHSWLRSVERHQQFTSSYAAARGSDGRLLGATPLYTARERPQERRFDPSAIFGALTEKPLFPATIVGLRAGYSTDFPFAKGLGAADHYRVLSGLANEGRCSSGPAEGSFSWLYISSNVLARIRPVMPACPPVLLSEVSTSLHITWNDFEEYMTDQSAGRRRGIRRDLLTFERSACTISLARFDEHYEECVPLVVALQQRYGALDSVPVIRERLREQAMALGDSGMCFLCRLRGNLVGFSLFYKWRNELYARLVGFDYDRLPSDSRAYFSLLFYEPILHAINNDMHMIDYGISSIEAKAGRGAALQPRWSVLWHPGFDVSAPMAWSHNKAFREKIIARYHAYSRSLANDMWSTGSWQGLGVLEA